MSASVATHADTGVATEAELAKRKRDVRGRSAGASPDAERMDEEAVASGDAHTKHLPGQHDQDSHAGGGGSARTIAKPGEPTYEGGVYTAANGKKSRVDNEAGRVESTALQGLREGDPAHDESWAYNTEEGKAAMRDTIGDFAEAFIGDFAFTNAERKTDAYRTFISDVVKAAGKDFQPKKGFRTKEQRTEAYWLGRIRRGKSMVSEDYFVLPLVEKFIRKKGSQFCVVSHSGKNLGCGTSRAWAEKRLGQIEMFKHMKKSSVGGDEVEIAKALDDGRLVTSDDELAKFVAYQNYVYAKSLFAKHLPTQHDQQDHAGVKGAAGKVSHTPAQIREAAARQYAKDEAVSIAQARKKVTSGAHVPTTKIPKAENELVKIRQQAKEYVDGMEDWGVKDLAGSLGMKNVYSEEGVDIGAARKFVYKVIKEDFDIASDLATGLEKSLIAKADQACLKTIWSQAYKYYTGKWIAAAQQFVLKQDWNRAALAMAKARDGYQEEKNPKEWGCLDAWRQFYQDKVEGGK